MFPKTVFIGMEELLQVTHISSKFQKLCNDIESKQQQQKNVERENLQIPFLSSGICFHSTYLWQKTEIRNTKTNSIIVELTFHKRPWSYVENGGNQRKRVP